jgi:hypothetical protein
VGVFGALVEDFLLGGGVSVLPHAQGVDLAGEARVRRAPPLRSAFAQGRLRGRPGSGRRGRSRSPSRALAQNQMIEEPGPEGLSCAYVYSPA